MYDNVTNVLSNVWYYTNIHINMYICELYIECLLTLKVELDVSNYLPTPLFILQRQWN